MLTIARTIAVIALLSGAFCLSGCAEAGHGGNVDPAVMMEDDNPARNMDTPTRF